jgi:AcrR family transcriptional regulator
LTKTLGTRKRRHRARRGEGERLREEILTAAEALLLDTSDEAAVSIRAVAAAVGVTPPSIYRHFADKTELLWEVCSRHFEALDAAMAQEESSDPVERLRRRGLAYVRFGLEHPEHYRIMLMRRADPGGMPADPGRDEKMLAATGFSRILDDVREAIDTGAFKPADPLIVATGLWIVVHGLVSLVISNPRWPWPPVEQMVTELLDVQLHGLAATK